VRRSPVVGQLAAPVGIGRRRRAAEPAGRPLASACTLARSGQIAGRVCVISFVCSARARRASWALPAGRLAGGKPSQRLTELFRMPICWASSLGAHIGQTQHTDTQTPNRRRGLPGERPLGSGGPKEAGRVGSVQTSGGQGAQG